MRELTLRQLHTSAHCRFSLPRGFSGRGRAQRDLPPEGNFLRKTPEGRALTLGLSFFAG